MVTIAPDELYGLEVRTSDGSKLGTVDEVYVDDVTGQPDWAEVKGGFLRHRRSVVPLATAERENGLLRLPYDERRVKKAPEMDIGENIDAADEARLFDYYGVPYSGPTVTATTGVDDTSGADPAAGPTTVQVVAADAPEAVTPVAVTPVAVTPVAVTPDADAPEAVPPDAVAPDAVPPAVTTADAAPAEEGRAVT